MHTNLTTEDVVRTFVEYFEERGHRRITGSTLLPPPGDPVLFTTSGMIGVSRIIGQSTETPMPSPFSSRDKLSASATTPNLATQ